MTHASRGTACLALGLATCAVVVLAVVDARPFELERVCLGSSVALAGVGLRAAAIRALGSPFLDGIAWGPGQERVRCGVYRLRHPAELGTLLALGGTCWTSGSTAAPGILAAIVLPTSALRVALEERLLRSARASRNRGTSRGAPGAPGRPRSRSPGVAPSPQTGVEG